MSTELCPNDTICVNTNGNYRCQCSSGYLMVDGLCKSKCHAFYKNLIWIPYFSESAPPSISGESTFVITVGQASIYRFNVQDVYNNASVGVVGGIPQGATLSGAHGNYTLTWILSVPQNVSLTIYAIDSFNSTTWYSVHIALCGCQNGGKCTSDGLVVNDSNTVIMSCDCTRGV